MELLRFENIQNYVRKKIRNNWKSNLHNLFFDDDKTNSCNFKVGCIKRLCAAETCTDLMNCYLHGESRLNEMEEVQYLKSQGKDVQLLYRFFSHKSGFGQS